MIAPSVMKVWVWYAFLHSAAAIPGLSQGNDGNGIRGSGPVPSTRVPSVATLPSCRDEAVDSKKDSLVLPENKTLGQVSKHDADPYTGGDRSVSNRVKRWSQAVYLYEPDGPTRFGKPLTDPSK